MAVNESNAGIKPYKALMLCTNFRAGQILPSCGAVGSQDLAIALKEGLREREIPLRLETVHCMGKCHLGPTMRLIPRGPFIMGVQPENLDHVLDLLEARDYEALGRAYPLPTEHPDAEDGEEDDAA